MDADLEAARGAVFTHNTIADIGSGPAMMLAGNAGLDVEISSSWLTHAKVGLDGWGDVAVTADDDAFFGNQNDHARSADVDSVSRIARADPRYVDLAALAGADHTYFTDDDGWRSRAAEGTDGVRGARLAP